MRRLLTRLRSTGSISRRTLAVVAAAIVLVIGAGVGIAYAKWSSNGSGSAAVTAGGAPATVHVIAVTAGNNSSTRLVPGQAADLVLELNNSNSYPVTIVSITQNGAVSSSGGSGPGTPCAGGPGGNTGVQVPTNNSLSVTVASGPTTVVHIPNAAQMTSASASGCQGATFQIPVTITVQR